MNGYTSTQVCYIPFLYIYMYMYLYYNARLSVLTCVYSSSLWRHCMWLASYEFLVVYAVTIKVRMHLPNDYYPGRIMDNIVWE